MESKFIETAFSTYYRFSLYLKYNISIQTFCQPAAAAAWLNLRNWFHSTFRANADMLTLMEFTPQGVKVLLSLSSGFHFPFCQFITFQFFRLAGCWLYEYFLNQIMQAPYFERPMVWGYIIISVERPSSHIQAFQ